METDKMDVVDHSLDFLITDCGSISKEVLNFGFSSFLKLAEHVKKLPYNRPKDLADPVAVLRENCGTCSSKHRFLVALSHECKHREIELVIGVYEMCEDNTPGVGSVLVAASVDSIPEAHCYIRYKGRRYDFTGLPAGKLSYFSSLITEQSFLPKDLFETKTSLHQKIIAEWAEKHKMDFLRAWDLRESCIKALITGWSQ
jgi:hypothetical protein